MALPKSFTEIRIDPQGREFVVHRPTGVRYYIDRKADPLVRSTVSLSQQPHGERAATPSAPRAPVIVAGRQAPAPAAAPAPVAAVTVSRRRIVARFIKGSAPKEFSC
jgi:hypothetical protein